jgi:hypothetical protein
VANHRLDRYPRPLDGSTAPVCRHEYEDGAVVFTGTVRSRACRNCNRIEVMTDRTGEWVDIDAFLQRRIANRSGSV